MGKIIELSPDVYNRIAAGEVIENPASVIKELVENSFDAGATVLWIKVDQAGKKEICVTDNGEGMSEEDLRLSIKKHATSKIRKVEDLDRIDTLGFRGEALSSIVSISLTEISSRTSGMETGLRLSVSDNGKEVKESRVSMTQGTCVKVNRLFYNTPARLKFLKSESRELVHIKETLNRMILAHPEVRFEIKIDQEKPVIWKERKDLSERLEDIYGREFREELIPFHHEEPSLKVHGFLGKPSLHRPNRNYQFLFLNKRPIVTKYYSYWLSLGYENLLGIGRHPVAFLFLEMDGRDFDVNVHPSKKEVRFVNESLLGDLLIHSIRQVLNERPIIPGVKGGALSRDPGASGGNAFGLKKDLDRAIHTFLIKHEGEIKNGRSFPLTSSPGEEERRAAYNLFSLFNTYILLEESGSEEVLIIDQHAAHERIIYERLKRVQKEQKEVSQSLLIPVHVHLPDAEYQLVMDHRDLFQEAGYGLEDFGGRTVIIHSVPAYLRHQDDRRLFLDILSDLMENRQADRTGLREKMMMSMACHSAVRAGDHISKEEKESLVNELLVLEKRFTCPHGRPAVVRLGKKELEGWFQRK